MSRGGAIQRDSCQELAFRVEVTVVCMVLRGEETLLVVTSISGVSCELINIYLHPEKVVLLGQKLLEHLQSAQSRKNPLRIIGGDSNQLQTKSSSLFNGILNELNCSPPPPPPPPPNVPSFRRLDGYSSSLDFFLTQVPSYAHHLHHSKSFSFWPSYQPTGHGIHICKFIAVPPIAGSPDDLPAQAIPSSVFYQPPSQMVQTSTPSSLRSLQPLIRSLFSLSPPSLLPVKTTIWAWWRTKSRPPTPRLTDHHPHTLLQLLSGAKSTLGSSLTFRILSLPLSLSSRIIGSLSQFISFLLVSLDLTS